MLGFDSNYVPGWDCHGLPIEWKIEEENYRSKGKPKPDFRNSTAMVEFRQECRAYATHWLNVQREEFKRLGIIGDWDHPYATMSFPAEAADRARADEVRRQRHALSRLQARDVERGGEDRAGGGRGRVRGLHLGHGVGEIPGDLAGAWRARQCERRDLDHHALDAARQPRDLLLTEDRLRPLQGHRRARRQLGEDRRSPDPRRRARRRSVQAGARHRLREGARHPRRHDGRDRVRASAEEPAGGYDFTVPLLAGDHVTDDTGTGFVHTAPGHGREDFDVWTANARELDARGISTAIPYTVDENGAFTAQAPGFTGQARHQRQGRKGRRQRGRDQGAGRGRQAARRAAGSSTNIRIPGARRSR